MFQILLLLIISIQSATSSISGCNEECLLSQLLANVNKDKNIIFKSYDIANKQFMDNALIWVNPSHYFSYSFMQKITDRPNPTNDDFREKLHEIYLSNHNKLLLSITIKNNNMNESIIINDQDIQKLIGVYKFDEIQYEFENKVHCEHHNRLLLDGNSSEYNEDGPDNLEFDVLNQHTYDEYDWFLLIFIILVFGGCCMCFGWFTHKCWIKDKFVSDEDIESMGKDPKKTYTPMSPSDISLNKYNFAGFNIFGGNTPVVGTKKQKSKHAVIDSYSHTQIEQISNGIKQITPQQIPWPPQIPPRISLPMDTNSIKPIYKDPGTVGVESPDPMEPSQTHVSLMMNRQDSNSNTNIVTPSQDESVKHQDYNEEKLINLDIIVEGDDEPNELPISLQQQQLKDAYID